MMFFMSQTVFQIQSTLIVLLMSLGIIKRKNRKLHVPIMLTAIVWDIILVLQIEFTRSAIAKASKAVENSTILNVHVALALTTVLFYFVMLHTGRKLLKGDSRIRSKHALIGKITYLLRLATYITSFFVVTR